MLRRSTTPPAPGLGGPPDQVGGGLGRLHPDAQDEVAGLAHDPLAGLGDGQVVDLGTRPRHTEREEAPEGGHEVGDGEHRTQRPVLCHEHK